MQTLSETLGHPVLFHILCYYGKNGIASSTPGYLSTDPNIIDHQLECMQAFGGGGTGLIALTYGPFVSPFIHEACMRLCTAANALDMPFALCFDPWTVKNSDGSMPPLATCNSKMISVLQNADIQSLLSADNYLPGKPVLDFSIGCTPSVITASVPNIEYWLNGTDYDWEYIPNKPNKTKLPCAYVQFDDGTGADRNKEVWNQSNPARIVKSMGGKTFWSCNFSTVNNCNGKNYVQFVTWNDYDEQTAVEAWASMATGIKI